MDSSARPADPYDAAIGRARAASAALSRVAADLAAGRGVGDSAGDSDAHPMTTEQLLRRLSEDLNS